MDDIIIVSEDFDEHLKHIKITMDSLIHNNMKINLKKCKFFMKELKALGHVVSNGNIKMDPEKISAISKRKEPHNVRQLQSFLGGTNYYREFIQNYAEIAGPLHSLIKKDTKWCWTSLQQNAFDQLKLALTSYPILRAFDPKAETFLKPDASFYAVGAVLSQKDNEDKEYAVVYASRSLKNSEVNYGISKKECLAIVFAVRHFRIYLDGIKFKVITDHSALKWLMNAKDLSHSYARWAVYLQGFDFSIEYKPGKYHQDADMLSRPVIESNMILNVFESNLAQEAMDTNYIDRMIEDDDPYEYEPLLHFLKFGRHINGASRKHVNKVNRLRNNWILENGKLKCRKNINSPYLIYPRKARYNSILPYRWRSLWSNVHIRQDQGKIQLEKIKGPN